MKILLIGGGGFVGGHLKRALLQRGHEVFVADLPSVAAADPAIAAVDLTDRSTVEKVLEKFRPDRVFLLAAVSSVALSWKEPGLTAAVNIQGPLNVFNAMAEIVPAGRLIYIGSGEEYGTNCSEEHPFTEETACNPGNPYAVSKFASGKMLDLLSRKRGLECVHLRPFNHFGPFQREGFVIADFCAQIARAERGIGGSRIRVGNLAARRDFLYVEDVIRAYCMIAEAERIPHAVYNISTGSVHPVQYILDYLVAQARRKIEVEIDPARFRPVEVPVLIASNELIRKDFGWSPETTLEAGLVKTLDWWRERTARESK